MCACNMRRLCILFLNNLFLRVPLRSTEYRVTGSTLTVHFPLMFGLEGIPIVTFSLYLPLTYVNRLLYRLWQTFMGLSILPPSMEGGGDSEVPPRGVYMETRGISALPRSIRMYVFDWSLSKCVTNVRNRHTITCVEVEE